MTTTRRVRIALIGVVSIAAGITSPIAAGPPALPIRLADLAGTYHGRLWSGGEECPAVTRLMLGRGGVRGTYRFTEAGEVIRGTLGRFRLRGERAVWCRWKDRYGAGDLRMRFSRDLRSFRGLWSADGDEAWLPWRGCRRPVRPLPE